MAFFFISFFLFLPPVFFLSFFLSSFCSVFSFALSFFLSLLRCFLRSAVFLLSCYFSFLCPRADRLKQMVCRTTTSLSCIFQCFLWRAVHKGTLWNRTSTVESTIVLQHKCYTILLGFFLLFSLTTLYYWQMFLDRMVLWVFMNIPV